jgi:hypothetical protein
MRPWLAKLMAVLAVLVPVVFLFFLLKYFDRWSLEGQCARRRHAAGAFSLPDCERRRSACRRPAARC